MSLFDAFWTEALREAFPWAAPLFSAVTQLGSANFYVVMIAIGYWTLDKRSSRRAALLLLASSYTNYWLKISLGNPRPPSSNWLPGIEATNYSLPSGHAQTSTTIWGWLSLKTGKAWVWGLSLALILIIGLSRVYIGVHWLGDVMLGWVVGAVLLLAAYRLEDWVASVTLRYGADVLYLGLVVLGIASMILTESLFPVNLTGMEDNFGSNGGFMIGLGGGLMLEKRYVNFEVPESGDRRRGVLRVVLGLALVVLVLFGLSPVLPSEVYWLRAVRYALSVITALFIWPYLFTRFNL
jgi:membrane-associated phospholipid phosphatase